MNNKCANLYFLSTLACKLCDCLDEDELSILSADLSTLSDMIESLQARKENCKED